MLNLATRYYIRFTLATISATLLFAFVLGSVAAADQAKDSLERAWTERAEVLVDQAATGRADGRVYTQDVRAHRADLRNLMRNSGNNLPPEHKQLHMSMVLVGVLLKTAAGCQTGGHVVCPVSLMNQLRAVLKNTFIKLESWEGQTVAGVDIAVQPNE